MPSPANPKLSRRALCLAPLILALAACSTAGPLGSAAGARSKPVTPVAESVGSGSTKVGLLAADEPANLSDGASGSTYLAARLATTALAGTPITLIVRRYDAKPAALQKAAAELAQSGARAIIVPGDDQSAQALAKIMAPQGVSVLTLGQTGNPADRLYAAGIVQQEVAFSAAEMKRRGLSTVAIARTSEAASIAYANALAEAAAGAGLKVQFVDAASAASAVSQLQSQASAGFEPKAIAFATGPARAAEIAAGLKAIPELAGVMLVGNGGWAFGAPTGIGKGFYPSLPKAGLDGFAQKFTTAFGTRPTVEAAIAYDLVVLGGALPQVTDNDPFGPTTMTNAQGFSGVTGGFRFDGKGVARRAFSAVELK